MREREAAWYNSKKEMRRDREGKRREGGKERGANDRKGEN